MILRWFIIFGEIVIYLVKKLLFLVIFFNFLVKKKINSGAHFNIIPYKNIA